VVSVPKINVALGIPRLQSLTLAHTKRGVLALMTTTPAFLRMQEPNPPPPQFLFFLNKKEVKINK
jgi:hypothetical protein